MYKASRSRYGVFITSDEPTICRGLTNSGDATDNMLMGEDGYGRGPYIDVREWNRVTAGVELEEKHVSAVGSINWSCFLTAAPSGIISETIDCVAILGPKWSLQRSSWTKIAPRACKACWTSLFTDANCPWPASWAAPWASYDSICLYRISFFCSRLAISRLRHLPVLLSDHILYLVTYYTYLSLVNLTSLPPVRSIEIEFPLYPVVYCNGYIYTPSPSCPRPTFKLWSSLIPLRPAKRRDKAASGFQRVPICWTTERQAL